MFVVYVNSKRLWINTVDEVSLKLAVSNPNGSDRLWECNHEDFLAASDSLMMYLQSLDPVIGTGECLDIQIERE